MAKKKQFKAESKRLLDLMINSIYTHKEIFLRELVSNASDAIDKYYYESQGHADASQFEIRIEPNKEARTLTISDTGIGLSKEELEENLGTIAKSGSLAFKEEMKKKEENNDEDVDIIGQFGVGFYSAFMVADEVHIDTLSYKEGAKPVHWVSNGGTEYEMEEGDKQEVGSTMTLYLNEDSLEFANEYRMREVLEKYCSFMPVEIFLTKANAEPEYETIDEADLKDDDEVIEHIHEDAKMEEKENLSLIHI